MRMNNYTKGLSVFLIGVAQYSKSLGLPIKVPGRYSRIELRTYRAACRLANGLATPPQYVELFCYVGLSSDLEM